MALYLASKAQNMHSCHSKIFATIIFEARMKELHEMHNFI